MNEPEKSKPFSFSKLEELRRIRLWIPDRAVECIPRLLATIDTLRFYADLGHLPICNVNKQSQWDEAQQALNDTPAEHRDEGWHLAVVDVAEKRQKCDCGWAAAEAVLLGRPVQDLDSGGHV